MPNKMGSPSEGIVNIAVNESGIPYIVYPALSCDACQGCADTCEVRGCHNCIIKRKQQINSNRPASYSICQVKRHNHTGSAWIISKDHIYDVTDFLSSHPGGKKSILRNTNGRDCKEDMGFHSKKANKMINKYYIGKLNPCPVDTFERSLPCNSNSNSSRTETLQLFPVKSVKLWDISTAEKNTVVNSCAIS